MARRLALPIAEAMVRSASSCVVPYDSKAPVAPAVHTGSSLAGCSQPISSVVAISAARSAKDCKPAVMSPKGLGMALGLSSPGCGNGIAPRSAVLFVTSMVLPGLSGLIGPWSGGVAGMAEDPQILAS
ncbi:MAG: hypothetical protein FRX49_01999 [Trebouxia sp. A1-2]|nr:MAG: hypothetical protein FRX49_01999 [Trebouxia sp. A1-2]